MNSFIPTYLFFKIIIFDSKGKKTQKKLRKLWQIVDVVIVRLSKYQNLTQEIQNYLNIWTTVWCWDHRELFQNWMKNKTAQTTNYRTQGNLLESHSLQLYLPKNYVSNNDDTGYCGCLIGKLFHPPHWILRVQATIKMICVNCQWRWSEPAGR